MVSESNRDQFVLYSELRGIRAARRGGFGFALIGEAVGGLNERM